MTAVQTTTTTTRTTTVANDVTRFTSWVKVVTHDLQKPASLVVGILMAMGVAPAPAGKQVTGLALVAYAALAHVVETIKGTSTGNGA